MAAKEEEHDPLDDVESLPRVEAMGWSVIPKPPKVEREINVKKAHIGWTLKPWSKKPTKAMVTMSDIGLGAKARGGAKPARRPRREVPKPLQTDEPE